MSIKKEFWICTSVAKDNGIETGVLGLIAKVRDILHNNKNWSVCCVVIGNNTKDASNTLSEYVEKVYSVCDVSLKELDHIAYSDILVPMIQKEKPEILLFNVSNFNSILSAALGARLKTGVIAHAVDIRMDENDCIVGIIPAWGGNYMGEITCPNHKPQIIGYRSTNNCIDKLNTKGEVISVILPNRVSARSSIYRFIEEYLPVNEGKAIESAEFIVCGGLGVGNHENWEKLEKIAKMLGAEIACTRPPVDEGWVNSERKMIGISGKYVSPKIYIGFGVSGSSHHMCGMQDSKIVININKDKNAKSMLNSDYVIESDVENILNDLKNILCA